MAATIWLWVRDEMKMPTAIIAAPYSSEPTTVPKIRGQSGEEKNEMTTAGIRLAPSAMANTRNAARNLPNTMAPTPTGAVSRPWSVLLRISSLKLRIVRIGSRIIMHQVNSEL